MTGHTRPGPVAALRARLGDGARLLDSNLDRHARAADATHFQLVPQAVAVARDAADVGRIVRAADELGLPVTFRSGGTSLSGQAVTDGVLIDVRSGFRAVEILDDGLRVRVQPGVTLAAVNARLRRHGRRLGPDPASEVACTVGGVIANNSSGMACGTAENTYSTLESMTVVLPSGTVFDTAAPDADARLRHHEPDLHSGLLRLARRIRDSPPSVATLRRQFAMKNTMGYGLNAFLDHDDPARILAHLVVGSEGTLGFVAEAVFRTVPLRSHAATALVVFDDLLTANRALPALVGSGAATLELLDATSLTVGAALDDAPGRVRTLDVDAHAALLVEYQATSAEQLAERTGAAAPLLRTLPGTTPVSLSTDPAERAGLWKLRKGLYAAVAGARPAGTTALLEDVVVPVDELGDTCSELRSLFEKYSYRSSTIFGHAKDGNIHFMLTDRFAGGDALDRYARFTEDMVAVVLDRGGSLKAEHGTGRVMAPYVRRQYGDELYAVMRELKTLVDPGGVLNPGVVLTDDPELHLRHLKTVSTVETEVDRCVECGYCEPVCPSRDLTLTPRQRIVARRAQAAATARGDHELAADLAEDYDYDGVQTCAVDGMCQTACPVLINTGDLVRRLRTESQGPVAARGWNLAARHWSGATRVASAALGTAARLPAPLVGTGSRMLRRAGPADSVPQWSPDLPTGGPRRARPAPAGSPAAIYVPACVNAMFGSATTGVQAALERLCARAGIALLVPPGVDGLCCGTPWSSKGLAAGHATMTGRVAETIAGSAAGLPAGDRPVVVADASSCTEGLHAALAGHGVDAEVVDAVAFVAEHVLPRLPPARKVQTLVLHPTCSSVRLGLGDALTRLAGAVAVRTAVPDSWGCCGFAGDRGLLHPELTAAATAEQAAEIRELDGDAHASCNRTCEIGMTRATGRTYEHILELLDRQIGPPPPSR